MAEQVSGQKRDQRAKKTERGKCRTPLFDSAKLVTADYLLAVGRVVLEPST